MFTIFVNEMTQIGKACLNVIKLIILESNQIRRLPIVWIRGLFFSWKFMVFKILDMSQAWFDLNRLSVIEPKIKNSETTNWFES